MAEEVSDAPDPREMDMLLSTGRAHLLRAVRDGDQRPRPPRDLADRLAGGNRHRRVAHQGAHHRRARRPHQGGAGGGQHRARRGLSGRLEHGAQRHDARPRRLRHDAPSPSRPRSARRSARSTPTSSGVYTADPRIVPDARKLDDRLLRGDARDGRLGRRRAAAALGRVRAQPRRAHPLPLLLRGRARYRCASQKEKRWSSR